MQIEAKTIPRLDFNKPPPEYIIDEQDDGWWWWLAEPEDGNAVAIQTEVDTRTAAWAHYQERHDPPGMRVVCRGAIWTWGPLVAAHTDALDARGHALDETTARAAAWAWYWRRLALAARLDSDVVVVVDCPGTDATRVPAPRRRVAEVILPMLFAVDEPAEYQLAEAREQAETLLSEGRLTFESGPPILLDKFDVWPRCLAWYDDQVAGVERWLVDPTAELPEVLRG